MERNDRILSTSPTSVSRVAFVPYPEVQRDNGSDGGAHRGKPPGVPVSEKNNKGDMRHPMHPGWNDTKTGGWSWTQPKGNNGRRYTPLVNTQDAGSQEIAANQAITHGFQLSKQGYLPEAVLQFLTDSNEVPWGLDDDTVKA
jgi:hypothetical protein